MIPRERPRDPIIQRNLEDRTATAGIRRRAVAEIRKRFAAVLTDVLAAFDRIPLYQVNDDRAPTVRYGLTAEQLSGIAEELQATLERWIVDGRDPSHVAWFETFQAEAAQKGAAQSVANLTNLSPAYAAVRSLVTVLYSEPYANRARIAKFRNNEYWTGLAAEQRATLAQTIGRAVADGQNPKVVRKAIAEALDVGKARAMLYAQTEVTGVLREARMAEAQDASDALGLSIGLLWTSALMRTTRPWHASRNGQVYTAEEVKTFYSQRGNRFRCHCATTECLLDEDGAPILTKKLRSTMNNEKRAWQSQHAAGSDEGDS